MKPVYLTRIELREFRSFSTLEIDLPDGPGVLISHGPNGLGKSSLFDGFEWVMTGKIDHFRDARSAPASQYLRNWNSPPDRQTQIQLCFGHECIRRTLSSGLDPNAVTDVVGLLQDDAWQKPIRHLDRYLLLTHFLGQSTVSRMTHRDAKERWEFLQEPAQSDRAVEIVKGLHGHGASTPARAYERRSNDLAKEARELERLLQLEQDQWREAQLEGAVDDRTAALEATAINTELAGLLRDLGDSSTEPANVSVDSAELVTQLRERAAEALRARAEHLERARSIVSERYAAEVDLAGAQGALSALARQVEGSRPDLEERRAAAMRARAAVDEATARYRELHAASTAFEELRRVRSAEAGDRSNLEAARALFSSLAEQLKKAEGQVREAERRRALAERLVSSLTEAEAEYGRISSQRERVTAAIEAAAARAEAASNVDRLGFENPNLDVDIEAARADVQDAETNAKAIKAELEDTRQSVSELSAAIATVAARLPHEASECPVCATSFQTAKELRSRVGQAVDRLAPTVSALETRVVAAEQHRKQTYDRLEQLNAKFAELQSSRHTLEDTETELISALASIGTPQQISEPELPGLRIRLDSTLADISFRIRRARHWLEHEVVGGATGALLRWTEATRARNEIAASLEATRQSIAELERRHRETTVALAGQASAVGIVPGVSDDDLAASQAQQLARERESETVLSQSRAALETTEASLASAEASAGELTARIAELNKQIEDLNARIQQYQEMWQALKLGKGPISAEALREPLGRLPTQQAQLAALSERIDRLRDGRLAWSRQQRHRVTLEQLRSILGAAPNTQPENLRRSASERQSDLLRRSEELLRAKRIAQDATAEVTRRVDEFNRQFLEPLNKLMNRINRAILSEPDIGLDLKVGQKKIEQRAIVPPGAPAFVSSLDPKLTHSEGQMAALAVSMLTASSLTFPWSRWPALIMDDPLQHNDVIHAAAFADLLRNLILERNYQLFLSTHDLGQAEFLRRKFQAANIPCTMLHLLGRGNRGVEWRVTQAGSAEASHERIAPAG